VKRAHSAEAAAHMARPEPRSRPPRPKCPARIAPLPEEFTAYEEARRQAWADAKLAPREAEIMELRYGERLSEREVAARLGITAGTIKQAASRARKKIAQVRRG
jgi:RNA polymerase sigma factor (sigma-70 family)